MDFDSDKLRKLIEHYAKPRWKEKDKEWWLRDGGGEEYLQEMVLKKAAPFLKEEELTKGAKAAVINTLKNHQNLMSAYDQMYARIFIDQADEEELKSQVLALLCGPEQLETRLRRFLEWARVQPIPGTTKKRGFSLAVASYLLAMTDPRQFPFCKPVVYLGAVEALIGKEAQKSDPIERIQHCKELYTLALEVLEREYGLLDGNLLDVHSLFWLFKSQNWTPPESTPVEYPLSRPDLLFDLLLDRHNVVLYGPPGTGKTMEALQLARWWRSEFGEDTVAQVTFHPSYSYEDFIEGFRPTPDGTGFELREGVFKGLCRKAASSPKTRYLLIIDEINRGDVARILGELITLLEGDKRGEAFSSLLPQSGKRFWVPENLYILGTMNTADKSISLMDLAIRRRFLFYPCPPKPEVLEDGKTFIDEFENVRLSQLLIGLNQRLMEVGIDRDRVLGHSYLIIRKDARNPLEVLKKRFRYEIYPLVEEYCYTDRSLLKRVLADLVDEWGVLDEEVFESDQRFMATLAILSEIPP